MSTGVIAAVALVPLVIGWTAGRRFERATRGWTDYRARKAELPIVLAAARSLTARAAGVVLIAAAIATFALYMLATTEGSS
ncbi:MAG: hypothetical protein ACRDUA_21680 [Micromonosporaceae bacterium]